MSKKLGRENDTVEVVAEPNKSDTAVREEAVLAFWREHNVFNKSLLTPAGTVPKGDFIFYDGPPFATGLPHYGHLLAGTIKDAIPRFKTMQGYHVRRQWGWDCHGLPLENQIEKELGLATKRDIEAFGVQNFNEKARGTVLRYADDWRQVVPRMGRFVDMDNDYKTMDSNYTESVWWVFKSLHEKGLVYEGFKSMHLCPRCGTTLSNFEVNQGYKDIKDIAVTVKLPLLDEAGNPTDTSLLVWTTTPWTMPGNMAAAVHQDFEYVKVRVTIDGSGDFVILAKGRLVQLGDVAHEVVETMKGSDLVGRKYQPPFPWLAAQDFEGKENAWTIYHADYVELGEDGTGAVHLAPAYGEEDMQLAKANGVPIVHHVDDSGRFKDFVTDFAGLLVKPKDDDAAEVSHLDTDIEIVKALKANGRLFKKENITHSYPHCWRCDTPLLNYATTSWFVRVTDIKDKLVAENAKVKWVPEHVGQNRFGDWLEGAHDWAVSRQRYWGAPLPIWKNPVTGEYKVFGSLSDLKAFVPKRGNRYYVARHAEAASNLTGEISALPNEGNTLTERGLEQCDQMAASLSNTGITKIVHSGLTRTRQTAERVAAALGLSPDAIIADERVREYQAGTAWEGRLWSEFNAQFSFEAEKFVTPIPGAETRHELITRVGNFLYEFDAAHTNETVLVIGHGSSVFALQAAAEGADMKRKVTLKEAGYLGNAEVRELPFTPLPHNDIYELDYHRPYIDNIDLYEGETKLVRVPDVFDCWFESGSMPYAQFHYPFSCDAETFSKKHFPADFIAEGLDQTRGWFYSLLVLGVALFGTSPFKHVVVNGLALAADGKKMSKSLRNYPDPMELVDKFGADAMRYYLLTSPLVRGEDMNFLEKDVDELQRKNIGRLHNVLAMYELFADGTLANSDSPHVLDRWIVTRLNQLVTDVTNGYERYELDKANRPIGDFIDDVSVWYLRRSRDRLKADDVVDKQLALGTLRHVLRTLALAMAPAMPFYADYLWQRVRHDGDAVSVHLAAWPITGTVTGDLIIDMAATREIVTLALEARSKSGVKVRQPIKSVSGPLLSDEMRKIILEELNAKEYLVADTVVIDATLTPDLLAEGAVRELIRAIQDARKQAGLEPADRITLTVAADEQSTAALTAHETMVTKTVGADTVIMAPTDGTTVGTDGYQFTFTIVKV